jgi:dihydroneopterin aldolase
VTNDCITLKGIKGFGYHGVFPEETKNGQDFFVDLELCLDLSKPSRSDSLEETIDYGSLTSVVVEEIAGEPVQLIERLAGRIADRIKAAHPEITELAVTVHKPHAPVSADVTDISVTIHR